MIRFLRASIVCLPLFATACAINPVSRRPEVVVLSVEQERQIGSEEAEKVATSIGLVQDPTLVRWVQQIGARLAAKSPRQDIPYEFHVVDMPEPNAFALPGGYVYVTRGLLMLINSEDELAGVLGHEIGHVAARHSVSRVTKATPLAVVFGLPAAATSMVSPAMGGAIAGIGGLANASLLAPYSRGQEHQADEIGVKLAAESGWDPEALPSFLATLEREVVLLSGEERESTFLDTHPSNPERVKRTLREAQTVERVPRRAIARNRAELMARLDGLVIGVDPAGGVFRDHHFLQPALGFALDFPEGWQTQNTPHLVLAGTEKGDALLALAVQQEGSDPVAAGLALAAKLEVDLSVEPLAGTSLPTAYSVETVRSRSGELMREIYWIAHRGLIYRIVGLALAKRASAMAPVFRGVARSMRAMGEDEIASVQEVRLRVERAQGGETVGPLLERVGSPWPPEQGAVANGVEIDTALEAGWPVKVAIRQPFKRR